jgi:pimeloyl-ACP methyl ester carboxylesterase
VSGDGIPLVRVATLFTHLEYDEKTPVMREVHSGLLRFCRVLRYDMRGTGMSDRNVTDFSLDSLVSDLAAVIEASGFERFALFGQLMGGAESIVYAIRNPRRVSHVIAYNSYARGLALRFKEGPALASGLLVHIRRGWGSNDPAHAQLVRRRYFPDASTEQMRAIMETERVCATPEAAEEIYRTVTTVNIPDLLPKVTTPTLIIQSRHAAAPGLEIGKELAAAIPRSRFVILDNSSQLLLGGDPAVDTFLGEIARFLGRSPRATWKARLQGAGHSIVAYGHNVATSPGYRTTYAIFALMAAIATVVYYILALL